MCWQRDFLVGVPNPFCRWKASWTLVSALCSLYFVLLLIPLPYSSQCLGETPDGEDFEAFIGTEKANEFKKLFSNWVHKIYRKLPRSRFIAITAYPFVMAAESEWARFSLTTPAGSTPIATAEGGRDDVEVAPLLNQSNASSNQSDVPPGLRDAIQPDAAVDCGDSTPPPPNPVTSTTTTSPLNVDPTPSLPADGSQHIVPRRLHSSMSAAPPSSLSSRILSRARTSTASNVLVYVADEPAWMERKGTLDYLRGTSKLGHLPSIIENWYELERLLGFPDAVSISGQFCLYFAHDI